MPNRSFSRRDVLEASMVLTAGAVFAEPLKGAAPEPSTISTSMIDAARQERVVAFYTAMEIPVAERLTEAFEAKYPGITVRVRRSGAERVFDCIGREQQIDLHQVDVVCSTNAGHFIHWKRNGLLAPYLPEDAAKSFPREQVDPDGMYATAFATLSPIGYNADLVTPEDAPRSFADLLDPKWKGKIVKSHPDYSGTILTATFQLARDLGWAYFEKLAQQNVLQVQSALDPPRKLALGESAVQVDGVEANLVLLKEQGAPVEVVYATEGTPLVTAPSGIFQSAPSPNAARLFQSFLLGLEAQQLVIDGYALHSFHALAKEKPGRKPLSAIKLMKNDPVANEAQREQIQERYRKIFGAG
jgi:iron(III) transport system substrate-binding protein